MITTEVQLREQLAKAKAHLRTHELADYGWLIECPEQLVLAAVSMQRVMLEAARRAVDERRVSLGYALDTFAAERAVMERVRIEALGRLGELTAPVDPVAVSTGLRAMDILGENKL